MREQEGTKVSVSTSAIDQLLASLQQEVQKRAAGEMERVIKKVFDDRRELWIESIFLMLRENIDEVERGGSSEVRDSSSGEWMAIASLSQLRREVGGRFQNLRSRWLEAGFPLKAHRGDPSEDYNLDEEGWLEMTSWLLKQGYESRLLEDLSEGYFEIHKSN